MKQRAKIRGRWKHPTNINLDCFSNSKQV